MPQNARRYCSKGLVGSFAGSVSLRIVCCADILVDIEKAAEFGGES